MEKLKPLGMKRLISPVLALWSMPPELAFLPTILSSLSLNLLLKSNNLLKGSTPALGLENIPLSARLIRFDSEHGVLLEFVK